MVLTARRRLSRCTERLPSHPPPRRQRTIPPAAARWIHPQPRTRTSLERPSPKRMLSECPE
eukprot:1913682-Prymnesium_polylepis.1